MASSTELRKGNLTSSTRLAAGIILGLDGFATVLIGGIFVSQTISEALNKVQMVAPV